VRWDGRFGAHVQKHQHQNRKRVQRPPQERHCSSPMPPSALPPWMMFGYMRVRENGSVVVFGTAWRSFIRISTFPSSIAHPQHGQHALDDRRLCIRVLILDGMDIFDTVTVATRDGRCVVDVVKRERIGCSVRVLARCGCRHVSTSNKCIDFPALLCCCCLINSIPPSTGSISPASRQRVYRLVSTRPVPEKRCKLRASSWAWDKEKSAVSGSVDSLQPRVPRMFQTVHVASAAKETARLAHG